MSEPQLDALKSVDAQITSTLQDYRTLHERTLNTLQTMAQNLRGDELWPTDVAGPIFLVQRSYNERRSQLDERWGRLLVQRRGLIQTQTAQAETVEILRHQLALTERLREQALPGLLEFEIPPLRRDQQVSTQKTREFYEIVIANLETIGRGFEAIEQLWQANTRTYEVSLSQRRDAILQKLRAQPPTNSEETDAYQPINRKNMPLSGLRFNVDEIQQVEQLDVEISNVLRDMNAVAKQGRQQLTLMLIESNILDLANDNGIKRLMRLLNRSKDEFSGPVARLAKLSEERIDLLVKQTYLGGPEWLWFDETSRSEDMLIYIQRNPLALRSYPYEEDFQHWLDFIRFTQQHVARRQSILTEEAVQLLEAVAENYQELIAALDAADKTWNTNRFDWRHLYERRRAVDSDLFKDREIGSDQEEAIPSAWYEETEPFDLRESGSSEFYADQPSESEPMKPSKPNPVDPTPPIRHRQEVPEQQTQHQSAEPPAEEAEYTPVDPDDFDDEIAFGGQPPEPVPPPPPPVIVPAAEPAKTEYAPPPMRAPGVSIAPEKKTTDGRLAQAVIEPTHFTAYAPKEVPPAQWVNLAAYIFRASAGGAVENDAQQKFGAQLAEMRHGKAAAVREIEEGATITATPRLDGFTFNPESLSLKFVKPYHRFDFEMMAGQERLNLASNGAITFSMGGVIVGEIPLSVFVGERATIEVGIVQAEPYQKIFCSYSHRDTKVVERVERAYRVLGFDYLRDATHLRSGQQWNAELMRWIDEAHIFQLFWSAAAAESPYVEQEWRHALQITRPNFIRPVYWKKPLVAPPSELGKLHFAYDPQIQGAGWWNKVVGLVRGE